jgi:lipoprotein-anchoring transpeptidase ErfK/SrfK
MRARFFVSVAFAALLAAIPQAEAISATDAKSSSGEASPPPPPSQPNAKTEPLVAPGSEPSSGPQPEAKPDTREAAEDSPPKPAVTLDLDIDLTTQRMRVTAGGKLEHVWPISSGRQGYRTPTGTFRPQWRAKMWYSRQWDDAPMPHAIFFHNGVAIHGTYAIRQLGRPASHGCVRLAPSHAATLYALVGKHGMGATRIVVHGAPRFGDDAIARREHESWPQRYSDVPRYAPRYAPLPRLSRYGGRRTVRVYPENDFLPFPFPYPRWGRSRRGAPFGIPEW